VQYVVSTAGYFFRLPYHTAYIYVYLFYPVINVIRSSGNAIVKTWALNCQQTASRQMLAWSSAIFPPSMGIAGNKKNISAWSSQWPGFTYGSCKVSKKKQPCVGLFSGKSHHQLGKEQ
jgi:hypothetical protein